jgi:hypothetical protein
MVESDRRPFKERGEQIEPFQKRYEGTIAVSSKQKLNDLFAY